MAKTYAPTRREAIGTLMATATVALASCAAPRTAESDTRTVRVIATSDLHGKMLPWSYPADKEVPTGSMAQLATAIAEFRDERTLLIDVGDSIQDNMAEVFASVSSATAARARGKRP